MSLATYVTMGWGLTILAFAAFASDARGGSLSEHVVCMVGIFVFWPLALLVLIGMAIREAVLKARGGEHTGHIIGPATGTPPIGDTYHFDGGTVTFNFVEVGENTADIAGIVLLFDSGESHTFAYAKAGFACPTSVELQGFTIE